MHEAPSYAGADYVGVKRTGASELIGVARDLAGDRVLGLALLLGALVWVLACARAAAGVVAGA